MCQNVKVLSKIWRGRVICLCVCIGLFVCVCLLSEKYFRRKLRAILTLHGEIALAVESVDSLFSFDKTHPVSVSQNNGYGHVALVCILGHASLEIFAHSRLKK